MCGIAGIVAFRCDGVEPNELDRMAKAIAHRGPDGQGIWIEATKTVGFAHRRLAIIDTSADNEQPLHDVSGRYVIVFNGEIYNFLELRAELEALGSHFRTDGDTEVVVEAWRHWGTEMFQRMNGMWAFAIHDQVSGDTIFARDRFGVKPFYYAQQRGAFAFASEIRALLVLSWVDKTPDTEVVQRTLFDAFSVEGSDRTYLKAVRRLPAGHWAILSKGNLKVTRWWRTCDHLIDPSPDPRERVDRYRELFFDAIRLRMRSDVPIGTCLSGGFDSTAITCAISKIANDSSDHRREATDWRHAFVASFPGQSNDETPEASLAAAHAGLVPNILEISNTNALENIDRVLTDLDEVYIALPTAVWQLYAAIRKRGVSVSLDGHGADELMGAYRQEGQSLQFHARNLLAYMDSGFSPGSIVDTARSVLFTQAGYQFLRGYTLNAPTKLPTAFDNDLLPSRWGLSNRRLYNMFHVTILPTILRNFDRMSMAHGIETRMPFMDWRLVAYVMSLPDSDKVKGGESKHVAREAMAGLMPESIRKSRRKVGFASPMTEWMNGPLVPWVQQLFAKPNAAFDEIVNTPALLSRIRNLTASKAWTWRSAEHIWPYIQMRWVYARIAP